MNSFSRLTPTYVGPYLPEELRQRFEAFWRNQPCRYEPGGWVCDFGSGSFQCELLVVDLDSEVRGYAAGHLAIRPVEELKPYRIECYLDKKFDADAEIVESKIFASMTEAKAFLDSILAFPTPKIPAPY
jgi:hypothetical protein